MILQILQKKNKNKNVTMIQKTSQPALQNACLYMIDTA